MSTKQKQQDIIEEFSIFDDWMDRYQYIIEFSKQVEAIDPKFKTNETLIDGCQSNVWIHSEFKEGVMHFSVDSDAIITKGIASLLIRVFEGETPEEIANSELFFIKEIGLAQNLSPTRSNGLNSMINTIKEKARQLVIDNE
jgi:cysteine desulfuration protein SufE